MDQLFKNGMDYTAGYGYQNNNGNGLRMIPDGIVAPKGFKASGVHCGIRAGRTKRDLALIVSDVKCSAAGVYTKNLVKGAPVVLTKRNLEDGHAQAIICNSGNANTCNANGMEIASGMCELVHSRLGIQPDDVIVASTGVIGQSMSLEPIANGMDDLVMNLFDDESASRIAAEAIMTTDTALKEIAIEFEIDGKPCRMGAIAKGSGMINPNMATMLCFITSDVNIAPALLQKALSDDVLDSFNMVCVDGDTSTNDTVCIMANGLAGNELIGNVGLNYDKFCEALRAVTTYISRNIAKDGEGATKLIECNVSGAISKEQARILASSVVSSSLVKAAIFGADANWGRVLCALGYGGGVFDTNRVCVDFVSSVGSVHVCEKGFGVDFSEELAKEILSQDSIKINVSVGNGRGFATAWGCDLTYEYVKINGDYRT